MRFYMMKVLHDEGFTSRTGGRFYNADRGKVLHEAKPAFPAGPAASGGSPQPPAPSPKVKTGFGRTCAAKTDSRRHISCSLQDGDVRQGLK